MYTISNILNDIDSGCVANNLNEEYFSYRIIFFVNENGIGTKHYTDTSYGDLRNALENIIRKNLSVTNSVAIAQITVLKGGKSVSLLSRSYIFSLDEYFRQIYGICRNDNKGGNMAYGRLAYAVQ